MKFEMSLSKGLPKAHCAQQQKIGLGKHLIATKAWRLIRKRFGIL
jgi:hypothetical protein